LECFPEGRKTKAEIRGPQMAIKRFQELTVYQVAEQLADELWSIMRGWDYIAQDTVGKQMVRAADSIGANIAEGSGRKSYQDNRRFVRIARGSLYETQHWLRRAFQRKLLTPDQVAKLQPLIERLGPLLNGYLRSIGRSGPKTEFRPNDEGRVTKDDPK
jgi:four helix bundle protein